MTSRGSAGQSNGALPQTKICQFKLVLLGDMAVGKSSLVLRFVKGQFDEFQETTIGGEGRALPFGFSPSSWFVNGGVLTLSSSVSSGVPGSVSVSGRDHSEV